MLTANDTIELEIVSCSSEGSGVARFDGMAVFVPGALLGERILAKIEKVNERFATARLLKVVSSSSSRVEPLCRYYSTCGGCDLMHMCCEEQLVFKTRRVRDALERIGGFSNIEVLPCVGADTLLHCRNKAVFSFAERNGKVISGCIAEKSHSVVPVKDCLIQSETANAALGIVTKWANECNVPAYNEKTGKGCLRHLMIRTASTGETMVVIVSAYPIPAEKELTARLKSGISTIASIINNLNPLKTSPLLGKKERTLFGASSIREKLFEFEFSVSAQSFLQVNTEQTLKLYSKAIAALELNINDNVVDLYCGIGTISLLMAKRAASVIGIEYIDRAIEDAKSNAARNGIGNAEFICGAAESVLPKLVASGIRIDKLLLDPPRKGAAREAIDAIIKSGVKTLCYVSCDPSTLARDCKLLAQAGYSISFVQPFDLFPQSHHVETVVSLSRK